MSRARAFTAFLAAALGAACGPAAALDAPTPLDAPQLSPPRLPAPQDDAAPAKPEVPPAVLRKQKLDDLFARLAASTDADETNGLVGAINRLELDSGSPTGDLLMARAIAALGARNLEISRDLLDKVVALRPDWAEAWNKRATVRYLLGDENGSMADIAHVLALEPRHLGALSGMGVILEQRGLADEAMRAYRRALEIAPQLPSLRAAVDRLKPKVDGQSL